MVSITVINSDWWHEGWVSVLIMVVIMVPVIVVTVVMVIIVTVMVWSVLMSSGWGSVVELPVVWTNIWVVGFVNMNLSDFVVWLKVKIDSVMVNIMRSVHVVWRVMIPRVISVVGPVIVMVDRGVEQISEDWLVVSNIIVIIKIVMDWLIVTVS